MAEIRLKDVRAFFPVLFKAETNPKFPKAPPRYSIVAMVEPGSDNDRIIRAAIEEEGKRHFEKRWPKVKEEIKWAKNSFCYFDGDRETDDKNVIRAGYEGLWFLRAGRKHVRDGDGPLVLDNVKGPDGKIALAKEGRIYSGCYVNLLADIFAFSKQGAGVSCGLRTVQFWRDGESFGGGKPTDEGFDAIEVEATFDDDISF